MVKKILLFIVVCVGMIALNAGFFNRHVDLGFVKKPTMLQIVSNYNEKEIDTKLKKIEELKKKPGTEAQQMQLQAEVQGLYEKSAVTTDNIAVIELLHQALNRSNKLLGMLSNGEKDSIAIIDNGRIISPKEGLYFKIAMNYSIPMEITSNEQMIEAIRQGYITDMFLFSNNMLYLPIYDSTQRSTISVVKVRLTQEDMDKFVKFYKDNLPK